MRWAMIISTISWGSLVAEEGGVGGVLSAERVLWIRSLIRLMSRSVTAAAIVVRRSGEKEVTSLPDDEAAEVFACGILLSPLEGEVRRNLREKGCSGFRLGSEFGAVGGPRTTRSTMLA
jgi:hypothetical protein